MKFKHAIECNPGDPIWCDGCDHIDRKNGIMPMCLVWNRGLTDVPFGTPLRVPECLRAERAARKLTAETWETHEPALGEWARKCGKAQWDSLYLLNQYLREIEARHAEECSVLYDQVDEATACLWRTRDGLNCAADDILETAARLRPEGSMEGDPE